MKISELPRFDAADYIKSEEDEVAFLNAALEDGDDADFRRALDTIARSRGMREVADKVGGSRPSLYKALSAEGNPGFTTVRKVLDALGYTIEVKRSASSADAR